MVNDTGQQGDTITVRFPTGNLLLNLSKRTRIYRLGGKPGSIADLVAGVTIEVTGVENTRLGEVTRTFTVRVIHSPRVKGNPKP